MSSLHKTLDGFVTGDACLQYISKDIGILSKCPYTRVTTVESPRLYNNSMYIERVYTTELSRGYTDFDISLQKLSNDKSKRVIGLILDENDDGSFEVAILGNETIENCYNASIGYRYTAITRSEEVSAITHIWKSNLQPLFIYNESGVAPDMNVAGVYIQDLNTDNYFSVPLEEVFDYSPHFKRDTIMRGALLNTGRRGNDRYFLRGQSEIALDLALTNNKNNTLVIGCPFTIEMGVGVWCAFDELADSIYNFLSGNFYDFMEYNQSSMLNKINSFVWAIPETNYEEIINPLTPDSETAQVYEKHALQTVPVNLILTRNETFAQNYLTNGTIPPDAFLFPLDWSNIPQNIPTSSDTPGDDDNGGDDDTNNETSPSGIEGSPTVDGDPTTTSSKLNNNNVYWLQAGQLQSFITWFWTQAGEIIDLGDLWNRVTGLYNDLGSAVINVRYFPVNPNYLGGKSSASSIIVGMVEYAMACEILNKANPTKITLGTQAIPEKYNSFADYSPYTELQLYLPFHGWIALDVDIFMGNSVRVKAIYDYMSGTCQYLIYVVAGGNEYLVNTCEVKMAVDIPITLQSKNDRDSAIFSNVTSAMGNLLGAGASIATMNPIGLVMSTANSVASGANSAPMKMLGTQGENGAFYAPNKCAIYMKRPSYNRPKLYKSRVGYPCNRGVYLGTRPSGGDSSIDVATGYTTVYNPTITFSGNSLGGKMIKPYESEVQEIYNYLTEGVIL